MKYPNGHEFEYKPLRPSQIRFDELYQRELDLKRARDIAHDFDGDIFNEPKISYRDGQNWCFDGMHSVYGWKIYHNNEDTPVMCKVFKEMTLLDEIDCFVKQTGHKKDLQIGDRLKALEAAHDPDVLKMKRGIESFGFKVNYGKSFKINTAVQCHAQVLRTYKSLPYEEYLLVFNAIKDLWWDQKDSTSKKVVKGMTEFFSIYHSQINYSMLIDHMRNESPNAMIQKAEEYGDKKGRYKYKYPYAFFIVDKYNKRLAVKNKLNEELTK
jgi:hypothetical protein